MSTSAKWLLVLLGVPAALFAYDRISGAGWQVGELREDGLRIVPSGRSDAGAVLDPEQFPDGPVRHAYWVATQIPETLNQLYCWCGCENRGVHRSNLQCFEDLMSVNCDVCRGTAEIAYRMVKERGITHAGRIQRAVDERWAPPGTELWEPPQS